MMEAMAMGIPCITTDSSPGPVDLLLSGDAPAGIICREGQDAEIVTAMLKLSGDAAYRARLGKAGVESVASQGWDALRGPWSEILDLRSRAPD
jgi:glycosyltransferase involved in cell wall biosynthesis